MFCLSYAPRRPERQSVSSPHESHRPRGLEGGPELLGHKRQLRDHRELHLGIMHLQGMISPARTGWDGRGMYDLDGAWLSAVAPSHLLVQLADGAIDRDIAELFVHVVRIRAAFIPEPDAIVFDLR